MTIRRIQKCDCNQTFKTGYKIFDFDEDGNPISLSYYLKKDQSNNCYSYILEKKGEIIGLLCIEIVHPFLYLSRIGIKQKYRGKGYSYCLDKFMMDIVEDKGIKLVIAEAHKDVWDWFTNRGYLKIHEHEHPHWGKSAKMMLLIAKHQI